MILLETGAYLLLEDDDYLALESNDPLMYWLWDYDGWDGPLAAEILRYRDSL